MEEKCFDETITSAAQTILSYCMARTRNQQDAEDLSQEILYALTKSSANLRDDAVFYGFMWSVAGNVTKAWYRKKARREIEIPCDDMVSVSDNAGLFDGAEDGDESIACLRRELSILSAKYRRATVLYYMRGMSCGEIARLLDISESMVKYLLFQSRAILKEGMTMERTYGTQSYDPKTLTLYYMGEGPNRFWELIDQHKIRQNILWACYYTALSEQEIALQIGVSLPYLEDDIRILTDAGLLLKTGKRYRTNMIILTEAYDKEKAPTVQKSADALAACITQFTENEIDAIRGIGFVGCEMSLGTLRWQLTTMLLQEAFTRTKTEQLSHLVYPVTAFGEHAYVWGVENARQSYNLSTIDGEYAELHFMDWLPCKSGDHHDFWGKQDRIRFLEKILCGYRGTLHETEEEIAAELIRRGYLYQNGETLAVSFPVFTKEQYRKLRALTEDTVTAMTSHATELYRAVVGILGNHVPTHLKHRVGDIAAMNLFDALTGAPTRVLLENGYLSCHYHANEMATVYAVLYGKRAACLPSV